MEAVGTDIFPREHTDIGAGLIKEGTNPGNENLYFNTMTDPENGLTRGNQMMTYCEHNHPTYNMQDLIDYFKVPTFDDKPNGFFEDLYPVKAFKTRVAQVKVKMGYICPLGGCTQSSKFCGYP